MSFNLLYIASKVGEIDVFDQIEIMNIGFQFVFFVFFFEFFEVVVKYEYFQIISIDLFKQF